MRIIAVVIVVGFLLFGFLNTYFWAVDLVARAYEHRECMMGGQSPRCSPPLFAAGERKGKEW